MGKNKRIRHGYGVVLKSKVDNKPAKIPPADVPMNVVKTSVRFTFASVINSSKNATVAMIRIPPASRLIQRGGRSILSFNGSDRSFCIYLLTTIKIFLTGPKIKKKNKRIHDLQRKWQWLH